MISFLRNKSAELIRITQILGEGQPCIEIDTKQLVIEF